MNRRCMGWRHRRQRNPRQRRCHPCIRRSPCMRYRHRSLLGCYCNYTLRAECIRRLCTDWHHCTRVRCLPGRGPASMRRLLCNCCYHRRPHCSARRHSPFEGHSHHVCTDYHRRIPRASLPDRFPENRRLQACKYFHPNKGPRSGHGCSPDPDRNYPMCTDYRRRMPAYSLPSSCPSCRRRSECKRCRRRIRMRWG
jgi:hypothetical protein